MTKLFKRFAGAYRRDFIVGPAFKLLEVVFDLITPLVIARMIDEGVSTHDVGAVVRYGIALLVMALVGILFTLVCQKMAALASQGMGTDIRRELYRAINRLSYAELDRITIEHLMSALYGLGVDNAFIEINGDEVPILDGSAKPYIDAISADGLMEQEALREYYNLDEEIHVTDAERVRKSFFIRLRRHLLMLPWITTRRFSACRRPIGIRQ